MLDIEVFDSDRVSSTGKSILDALQNNNTPNIDLFVRESIQNSLDAADDSNNPFVSVEFNSGSFEANRFNRLLGRVETRLNEKYTGVHEYLSVSDMHTTGLTGPLTQSEAKSVDKLGNWISLVYEINKTKSQEGAGGAWGYGKTIYYRLGSGTVLFYSRIKTDSGYENRLAISHVENDPENGILSGFTRIYKGLAWWGEKTDINRTRAVTDLAKIEEILDVFDMQPYEGDQTGTCIIMPYVKQDELLKHNRDIDPETELYDDIDEYLKTAIQRWYAPRLNNELYKHGKHLRTTVNGQDVAMDVELFRTIQEMYNCANGTAKPENDLIVTKINSSNSKLTQDRSVGTLVYKMFDFSELGMNRVADAWNPYYLTNQELDEGKATRQGRVNQPMISYTRKAGMIVNYSVANKWLSSVPNTPKDKYILAMFVVNSSNGIDVDGKVFQLDEYFRKAEESDHLEWEDHDRLGTKLKIITNARNQVANTLRKKFSPEEEEGERTTVSGRLSKLIGSRLLPSNNYGKAASKGEKVRSGGTDKLVRKSHQDSIKVGYDNVTYESGRMVVPFEIEVVNEPSQVTLELRIALEKGNVTVKGFEEKSGIKSPVLFDAINVFTQSGGTTTEIEKNDILVSNTAQKTTYAYSFETLEPSSRIYGNLYLIIEDKNIVPKIEREIREVRV